MTISPAFLFSKLICIVRSTSPSVGTKYPYCWGLISTFPIISLEVISLSKTVKVILLGIDYRSYVKR